MTIWKESLVSGQRTFCFFYSMTSCVFFKSYQHLAAVPQVITGSSLFPRCSTTLNGTKVFARSSVQILADTAIYDQESKKIPMLSGWKKWPTCHPLSITGTLAIYFTRHDCQLLYDREWECFVIAMGDDQKYTKALNMAGTMFYVDNLLHFKCALCSKLYSHTNPTFSGPKILIWQY